MVNNSKIEDEESSAQTLRPKIRFSQRPTIPIIPKTKIEQYPPIKYKFYLIGIIIIVVIITAIIFITKPLKSHSMPELVVFNLSPIIIPVDSDNEVKTIETPMPTISAKPVEKLITQPVKKIEVKNQIKDYGI